MFLDKEPNQVENVIRLSLSCGRLCHFSQRRQVFVFFYKLNFVQFVNIVNLLTGKFLTSYLISNYFCIFKAYKSAVKTLRRNSSCTLCWSVEVVPAAPVVFLSYTLGGVDWPLLNDDGDSSQLHHYCAIPVSSCKGPINETVPTGNRPISVGVNTALPVLTGCIRFFNLMLSDTHFIVHVVCLCKQQSKSSKNKSPRNLFIKFINSFKWLAALQTRERPPVVPLVPSAAYGSSPGILRSQRLVDINITRRWSKHFSCSLHLRYLSYLI